MEILKPSETLTEESSFEGEKRICNICTTSSDYHLLALLFLYSFIQYLLSTYDVRCDWACAVVSAGDSDK